MKNSIINLLILLAFLFSLTTHSFGQNTEFIYQVSNKATHEFIIQAEANGNVIAEKIIKPITDTSFSFICSNDQLQDASIVISYDSSHIEPLFEERIKEYADPDIIQRKIRQHAKRIIPISSLFSKTLIYIESIMPPRPIEQENTSFIKINLFIEELIEEKHQEL